MLELGLPPTTNYLGHGGAARCPPWLPQLPAWCAPPAGAGSSHLSHSQCRGLLFGCIA